MATRPPGNRKQIVLDSAVEKVVTVGIGKKISILADANGSTFDVVGYAYSPEEATRFGVTRTKRILEAGVTSANYSKTLTGPIAEVGIEVTAYVGDVVADIIIASEATGS